ncbi:MAG: hypothetical protein IKX40_13840 [Thermoguttaceae bacterium]|nr:hypothetical protein [Thermoguttaceae bacterium]
MKKAKDQVSFETNIWSNTYTDIYGLTCNVLQKDSCGNILKLNNGLLTDVTSQFDVSKSQNQLISLKETLDKKNVPVLFVLAPQKISPTDPQLPRGVKDVRNEKADQFIKFLEQRHIDYIDCRSIFASNPSEHYRLFLKSDFHWQPEYAFYAFRETACKLNRQYGFNIPEQYYDPSSFTEKHVPLEERPYRGQNINLELKATGRFFAPIDQFILFEPNFQTNTRFEIPHLNIVKEGNYTQTWRQSGVYAIQKSINYDVHNKKVCLIKDSFGASYFDYLTLSCHELLAIDPRNFKGDIVDEIDQFQPDIVILIYTVRMLSDLELNL